MPAPLSSVEKRCLSAAISALRWRSALALRLAPPRTAALAPAYSFNRAINAYARRNHTRSRLL
jgi:hypothetical protein